MTKQQNLEFYLILRTVSIDTTSNSTELNYQGNTEQDISRRRPGLKMYKSLKILLLIHLGADQGNGQVLL